MARQRTCCSAASQLTAAIPDINWVDSARAPALPERVHEAVRLHQDREAEFPEAVLPEQYLDVELQAQDHAAPRLAARLRETIGR